MANPYQAFTLILVAVLVLLVFKSQNRKEQANHIAKQFCKRNELQFLDGTVAFRGLHIDKPSLSVVLRFKFEYSVNSIDRYQGTMSFVGKQVQNIFVDPEHVKT